MKHVIESGTNKHAIITLHGTGGSAKDLFEIASFLDPFATKIGLEGSVNENGMLRYFARFPQGGFDLESLLSGTEDLNNSVHEIIKNHNLEDYKITVIAYSNGANIAKNWLKEYSNVPVSNAILFHPSPITPNKEFKEQNNLRVLMTSGKSDPYISEEQFRALKDKFLNANISVESFTHLHGHQMTQEELNAAKDFLTKDLKEIR